LGEDVIRDCLIPQVRDDICLKGLEKSLIKEFFGVSIFA